jgi:DNA-binding NtrC family response regulator
MPSQTARRILIVEDHADSADTMAILLGIRGHAVDVARTLGDAVKLCGERGYDVVLCDIELPDGSGMHIPSLAPPRKGPTEFIAVTGHATAWGFRTFQNAGFRTCLLKPVLPETLYEYVERGSTPVLAALADTAVHSVSAPN